MRTICLFFALSAFISCKVMAQEDKTASVSDELLKVETLFPNLIGVTYEMKLGQQLSLYNMLGFLTYGGGGLLSQSTLNSKNYFVLMPQISVQPRFYYNLKRRARNGKNTSYNAANYIGLTARVYHQSIFYSNANISGGSTGMDLMFSWGLQRNFLKRLNFDWAVQPGIQFYEDDAALFMGINLQLGFIVFAK